MFALGSIRLLLVGLGEVYMEGSYIQHHINVNQTAITVKKEWSGSMINLLRWFKYIVPLLFEPKYADL